MYKERNPSVGYYSRSYKKNDTENEKSCKKVYFSQIKRVSKEEMKMRADNEKELSELEELCRARRRGRHVWGKKKCTIIPKRIKRDAKPLPENIKTHKK